MTPARRGTATARIVLATALAAVCGCSLLVSTDATQCTRDRDCGPFAGTRCVAGGCVPRPPRLDAGDDAADPSCSSNQECVARAGRASMICRKSDSRCVSLLSRDCGTVIGATTNDATTVVGALLPTIGAQQSAGLAMINALRLAASELSSQPVASRRSVVVVVCNESEDVERAALHLTRDVRVPAIIGAMTTAATLDVAEKVTNDAGVLLLSPTASSGLDRVASAGLVATAAADDGLQGRALALAANELVAPRALARASGAPIRMAVVRRADVHGEALHQALIPSLALNGGLATEARNEGYFDDLDYGNPDDPLATDAVTRFAAAVSEVIRALPDVVVVLGYAEGASRFIRDVESLWPASAAARRPLYLLSSGVMTSDLFDVILPGDARALATRILGVAPGNDPRRDAKLARLFVRYAQTFPDAPTGRTFGVAHAYDALYMLAYALAAVGDTQAEAERGRAVAKALDRLAVRGAPSIDVGPDAVAAALAVIAPRAQGGLEGAIDLVGATGPLDPAVAGLARDSEMQIWCVLRDAASGQSSLELSGRYMTPAGTLEGALTGACAGL